MLTTRSEYDLLGLLHRRDVLPANESPVLGGQPAGKLVTTGFVREGFSLLKELHGDVPLTYVYTDLRDIVLRGNTGLDAHQAGQKLL